MFIFYVLSLLFAQVVYGLILLSLLVALLCFISRELSFRANDKRNFTVTPITVRAANDAAAIVDAHKANGIELVAHRTNSLIHRDSSVSLLSRLTIDDVPKNPIIILPWKTLDSLSHSASSSEALKCWPLPNIDTNVAVPSSLSTTNSQNSLQDFSQTSYTPFDDLSEEAICAIFMCLPPLEICRASIVCKAWYRFAYDKVLWKRVCRDRWESYGPLYMYIQPSTLQKVVPHIDPRRKPLECLFLLENNSKDTTMPPFMTEEDGPDWRRYYWYRDLQAKVWDSHMFTLFDQLNINGDMFGVTEGVRTVLLSAISIGLGPENERKSFDMEKLKVEPLFNWIIEVGSHSPAHAKSASSIFLSIASGTMPLRIVDAAVANKFPQICAFLLSIIKHNPDSIETLVTLMEKFPSIAIFQTEACRAVINQFFKIMITNPTAEDATNTDVIMYNIPKALDKISLLLGSQVYPFVKDNISEYSKSEDWRYRWKSLKAIMYTCKGFCSAFKADVKLGIPSIAVNLLEDPNSEVKLGAISAVGQMCIDLKPAMQLQSGSEIVEKLLKCMMDDNNTKCQMHACSAINNFFVSMGNNYKDDLKVVTSQVQDKLYSQLLKLFNNAERNVQKEAIRTIVNVVAKFGPTMSDELFKESMSSMLKWMDPLENSLWGYKIVSVSLLIASSPKQRVLPFLRKILDCFGTALRNMELDLSQRSYLLSGVSSVYNCDNYDAEFEPVLPEIVKHFFMIVNDAITIRAGGPDSDEEERIEVNGQVFYYPTKKAQLKELVIRVLKPLLNKEAMTAYSLQFVDPLFRCLLEKSKIKLAAVTCIPLIAKRLSNDPNHTKEFFSRIFTEFESVLSIEDSIGNIDVIAVCWKETIDNCISNTQVVAPVFEAGVLRRMMGVVCNKVTRCLEKFSPNKENEVDQATGAIGSLKSLIIKFLQCWGERVGSIIVESRLHHALENAKCKRAHYLIVSIYCDVIEHVPELAEAALLKLSAKRLLDYAKGGEIESLFALGYIGYYCPDLFKQYFVAKNILKKLLWIYSTVAYEKKERGYLKANCVAAAYRIIIKCLSGNEQVKMFQLLLKRTFIPTWDNVNMQTFFPQLVQFWNQNPQLHSEENSFKFEYFLTKISNVN